MSDVNTSQDDDLGAPDRPSAEGRDDGAFHTDTATANGVRQRGMGVGAAELAAQRDPGANPASPGGELPIHQPDDVESPSDPNRRA